MEWPNFDPPRAVAPKPLNEFRRNLEHIIYKYVGGVATQLMHMALRQRGQSQRTRDLSHVSVSDLLDSSAGAQPTPVN